MFCYQCEQTAKGTGCTVMGVCGKTAETANLQDLLIHSLIGLAYFGNELRKLKKPTVEADLAIIEGLFTTVTNVNFDHLKIADMIRNIFAFRQKLAKELGLNDYPEYAAFIPADTVTGMLEQSKSVSLFTQPGLDPDIRSLRSLLLFGLKGMAAYADHARVLGKTDDSVNEFFYKGLLAFKNNSLKVADLVALNMELGKVNIRCMELLDKGHHERYGHPHPTLVSLGVKKGPAILISGHDMLDLEQLLKQSEGLGINIYTHGEMLPAHGYPNLKKYSHLAGHYGTAWQNQIKEFAVFPGPVLMTTNCIQKPAEVYAKSIFTTGLVQWPNVSHIQAVNGKKDFGIIIQKALEMGGFKEDVSDKDIMVGFGWFALTNAAEKVARAIKDKKLRHLFLIGGCDGAKPGRNYYTEFAEKVPQDCIILTLACGKYRFNRHDFGELEGLPRLLDVGQCNDAYSAIKIAGLFVQVFDVGLNQLPLSLVLSWYEQKAVVILLSLLSLGIKNIRLGPSLPACLSDNVLSVLVKEFNIMKISTPEQDLKAILD